MPITTSYPGVYIEELPSASHAVTPAPTSVAVFIGYANPFWRSPGGTAPLFERHAPPFEDAVELNSFADYEAAFGGFFYSPWLPDHLGRAVFQFFMNGGSNAYVVALKPEKYLKAPKEEPTIEPAAIALGGKTNAIKLTALQPVGLAASTGSAQLGLTMQVTISNPTTVTVLNAKKESVTEEAADLTIEYGTAVETYRRLAFGQLIATLNQRSTLVYAESVGKPTKYEGPAAEVLSTGAIHTELEYSTKPGESWTTKIDLSAFAGVFKEHAPLDKVSIFNLMALPGLTESATLAEALAYCEDKRAFLIMDAPEIAVADSVAGELPGAPAENATIEEIWEGEVASSPAPPQSANGAIYFPYLQSTDPVTGEASISPPSGIVAGVFAKEDTNRGVWKSPAGLETTILGSTGVVPWGVMTDKQQGTLNRLGINCIRTFPGMGSVVFGARTLVSDNPAFEQWKYVAVRRMALFLEQSLFTSLRWAIFEPNDTPLWNALTQEVQAFMLGLYRQGAFQGSSADEAFKVQCDGTTTSQAEIDNGIVNIHVGFAPLKPAEFVVVQIQQLAGQTQS